MINYKNYIFKYGILSILYTLEYFESIEDYNECQNIIDAIKSIEERLDIRLFTVINQSTINEVIDTYKKFNLTGKNVIENSKCYAELIISDIKTNQTSCAQ